jgi:POT family proton-dependent oligopeptide transporter
MSDADAYHSTDSIYMVGCLIQLVSSLPISLDHGVGVGGLAASMVLIGIGAGGVKATFSPFLGTKSLD